MGAENNALNVVCPIGHNRAMPTVPKSRVAMPVDVTQSVAKAGALLRSASQERQGGFAERAEQLERIAYSLREKANHPHRSVSVVVLNPTGR